MPLTPRDKRTLMIGGGVLGVLLVGFLVMNLLSSGGSEDAFPSLPPITLDPGGKPGQVSTSPTVGVSPVPLFIGRDPFSIPPGLTTAAPTTTSSSVSVSTSTSTTASTSVSTSVSPTNPGGGDDVGGKTVVLVTVFMQGGAPMVQVSVDGQVFNDIGIGDTFDNGRYELRSISGDCATFLHGDESFTLCVGSDK